MTMGLSNDERGWIMTCISGVACVLGASIICADLIIRLFPGKRNFRIQDSDVFLSSSLSLSFGVMLFSALYSMLPSAKNSLIKGGFSPKAAAWTLIDSTTNRNGSAPEVAVDDEQDGVVSSDIPTLTGNGQDMSRSKSATSHANTEHSQHPAPHHHHVPTNAFLSIGLQTSIAIALHKLPEGFITYATNHANPKLGFSVFLALFIHNITEGFAMALPLYLAINSRWKAMFWSSLLGGFSQPLGAGVAALWFKLAGSGNMEPGEGIYGGMFAVTAGIMASVALQLFSESLDLTHNRGLCMIFAFVGMGILGISSALTA
ncbi:hypothetical protein MBLNU459_g4950t2 [Dothideomycetes sp. NU459]